MRVTRLMIPLLVVLAAAGCARQQQATYVIDPSTGQPVPVVQQYSAPQYAYAQAGYQGGYQAGYPQAAPEPSYAQTGGRGLFNAPPSYAQPQYGASGGRGLFGSRPPAYAQPQYPYQSYVLQYHPPAAAYPYQTAPYGYAYAPPNYQQSYTLDAGDKLRVVVFGQQGISGSYLVDAGGNVTLPLAGTVAARGFTTRQVAKEITDRLKQGYVREPHVTVTIEAYRPFFILGEVTTPGQYAYVPNMTVENAIAVAGGFAPRAEKDKVELSRNASGQRLTSDVPLNYPMRPGDTVVVKERWF
jgi:polysaccharide export outer membrane protein